MADLKTFQRYGEQIDSPSSWEAMTAEYLGKLDGPYHLHRLEVIKALVPDELRLSGKKIFDFGCGDAVLFPYFIEGGAEISGVDVAANMIDSAKKRLAALGCDSDAVRLGGVTEFFSFESASLDAVLSFNVLAYLTDEEERVFYEQTHRVLRKNGFLIVTHSSELFDLFSQNAYTINFLKTLSSPTYEAQIDTLAKKEESVTTYNIRENPLSYRHKLSSYGFEEIRQEFINKHDAPPVFLGSSKTYPTTLGLPESEKWKLNFTCSTFGSLSRKV